MDVGVGINLNQQVRSRLRAVEIDTLRGASKNAMLDSYFPHGAHGEAMGMDGPPMGLAKVWGINPRFICMPREGPWMTARAV